jgi:hypothetical protein
VGGSLNHPTLHSQRTIACTAGEAAAFFAALDPAMPLAADYGPELYSSTFKDQGIKLYVEKVELDNEAWVNDKNAPECIDVVHAVIRPEFV